MWNATIGILSPSTDNAALLADIAALSDADIAAAAIDLKVEFLPDETRDEKNAKIVFAIMDLTAAAAARAEADRQREEADRERAEFLKTPQGKKQRKVIEERPRNDAVRRVHSEFAGAIPTEARSSGAFTVPDTHVNAEQPAVPDGGYRVAGSDWVHRFQGGRWIVAERAHALKAPDWTDIPDSEPSFAVHG